MPETIYLFRHGATEDAGEVCFKGSIDVPLSPLGAEQVSKSAARLNDYLAAHGSKTDYLSLIHPHVDNSAPSSLPTAIYCSPLSRAKRSAEIIAERFGLSPQPVAELRERDFGRWEGLSFQQIRSDWPKEFAAWAENPCKNSPPDGESTMQVARRCRLAIKKILAKHKNEKIVIVGHGGINRVILCHYLQLPLRRIFNFEQSLACFNVIELWGQQPIVKRLNDHP